MTANATAEVRSFDDIQRRNAQGIPYDAGYVRHLTNHVVNGLNEQIEICVNDLPGPGNACHDYTIYLREGLGTPQIADDAKCYTEIKFQNGPIKEVGVNGISQEALLAILIDRLRGFQSGEYACKENGEALMCLEEALVTLQQRTLQRMARGVEGTNQK
jgi:hypothetical protein